MIPTSPTKIDSPWTTIGPPSARTRYIVLGEEDAEEIMIQGHGVADGRVWAVVVAAGFGQIFDDLVLNGVKVADGTTVADLHRTETWAREIRGCPQHRWIPWWLRVGVVGSMDWLRWQLFRGLWRTWWRRDPLRKLRAPRWLQWLGRHWRMFEDCATCQVVDHHRTCAGCVWCHNTPAGRGKPPELWDWATPDGAPADTNKGRSGYMPVTLISVGG